MKYPIATIFLAVTEFCERFTYYGVRTILPIYLTTKLALNGDVATTIFHTFCMVVYFFPIVGAMISDSWFGKYKTIVFSLIVYLIGSAILFGSSLIIFLYDWSRAATIIGLILIAIGTGTMKPCFIALAGDQFNAEKRKDWTQYFSYLYLSMSVGSLLSKFITPILRKDVQCFKELDCYPLAFGTTGILLLFAFVIFLFGSSRYVKKQPNKKKPVMVEFVKCVKHASVQKKLQSKTIAKDHWLDYADDKYDKEFINSVKMVIRILVLYIPLPVFAALYDQQGSRWTLQATQMNGDLGFFEIKPDQMQVVGPILVFILVPIFNKIIYPALAKVNLLKRPLSKMLVGGILASLAFVISGWVQLIMEKNYLSTNPNGPGLQIFNGYNCPLNIYIENYNQSTIEINPYDMVILKNFETLQPIYDYQIKESPCYEETNGTFKLDDEILYFWRQNLISNRSQMIEFRHIKTNMKHRSIINALTNAYECSNHTIQIYKGLNLKVGIDLENMILDNALKPDIYDLVIDGERLMNIDLKLDKKYTLIINFIKATEKYDVKLLDVTETNNKMHILWLLPQFLVMAISEVMFAITGFDFSYTQAPENMKSVVQAGWLLKSSIGNLIVVFIAGIRLSNIQSNEFFVFASLMMLSMVLFYFLIRNYQYVEQGKTNNDDITVQETLIPEVNTEKHKKPVIV